MSSATRSIFSRLTAPTLAASVPLVIWARDNIVGLVRVKGPSMEPTLQEGDIVWVRKADGGILPRFFRSLVFGDERDRNDEQDVTVIMHPSQQMFVQQDSEPSMARLYERPPQVRRGQVVVVKSVDTAFPDEWQIKRVWGTPGTWVKVEGGNSPDRRLYRKLQAVPSYSLYVGGDNEFCSRDSRQYGPVSQNLLVGVAEYIVWPPSRVQKIRSDVLSDHSVPNKDMNFPNAPRTRGL